MKIFLISMALLSHVLSDYPMNVQVTEHPQCIVNISESSIKQFNKSLENGRKVIFFRIHYNTKETEALTKPIPNDHFANPNEFMWLFNGEHGLSVYKRAPYDFDLLSLFVLREYTVILSVNMNVSKSCNEKILSRVDFLRLVFHQLIKIVSSAQLPGKKASAYICYDINNRKNLSDSSFLAYQQLGINREVLLRYCCEVKKFKPTNNGTDLCQGEQKNSSKGQDLQNYIGAFLLAFFPLAFGFISKAKLAGNHDAFAYIRSVSGSFHKGEQFKLPYGEENDWISEHDDRYSIFTFLKCLSCFYWSTTCASRIRRSLTIFMLLFTLLFDFVLQWIFYKDLFEIYLVDNIPLGYRSLMFGFKKSGENTKYFLGGPFIWFSAFVILGIFLVIIPERLCEHIAYSTLHQKKTITFLFQDIELLKEYGSFYESRPNERKPDGRNPDGRNVDEINPDEPLIALGNPDGCNPDGRNPDGRNVDEINPDESLIALGNPDGRNQDERNPDEYKLRDYDLLYAILKSSLLTALNPRFWCAVFKRWYERCKKIYNEFDNQLDFHQLLGVRVTNRFDIKRVFYRLLRVCITFLCAVIAFFLFVCELLLCIIWYGCPLLVFWKAIVLSYTQRYILPIIKQRELKILGFSLLLISLFVYLFLFLFSLHLFLTTFQLLSSYLIYTVVALLAKPDAIAYVLLFSSLFYIVISIVKSVSETYESLLKVSIKLAESVHEDFVYTRLGEKFIYNDLFERIVERHHPIRFEIAKALAKVVLIILFFISCVPSLDNIAFNLSTYIKIAALLLTTMIPKITTVLNKSLVNSRWKSERLLKTIYDYKLEHYHDHL